MTKQELAAKVRELKELKQMAEELQNEITFIEDTIKEEMTILEKDELFVDVFKIKWTEYTSNRFDTTAFKKTHEELYNQYVKQVRSKRFSVN